jgi:uncharacterized protein YjbI with pentapeptide repeats
LSVRGHTLEEVADSIEMGLLLTLQIHLRAGSASQILFGHKSFREFLVARFWADRLRALARAEYREWEDLERSLVGGRLLGSGDRAFDFLMDMLNADAPLHRPTAPFGLAEDERAVLLRWAQQRFESEVALPRAPGKPRLRDDQMPWLREAALAIGSELHGARGLRQRDVLTLRTLLGWFWAMRIDPGVRARGALLEGAWLNFAPLLGADFTGANLREADLGNTNLQSANLSDANLQGTSLSQASLQGAILHGTNLDQASLTLANLSAANLSDAHLSGAMLQGAYLGYANLSGASLQSANLHGANLGYANLHGANLRDAFFDRANLDGANLSNADLRGTVLSGAKLRGANLRGADLRGTDLTAGADLHGARYDSQTQWPDGFEPEAAGAILDEGASSSQPSSMQ